MAETKKIKTALVSVFHKDGLDELLAKLNEEGNTQIGRASCRERV